jgi:hypothetical protein
MGTITRTIRELEKVDMCVAASMIQVYNLTTCPPIWPLNRHKKNCDVKLYAFKECYEEFPMTVPVTVIDRTNSDRLTADQIRVKVGGEWKPLKDWLLKMPDRKMLLKNKARALRTQQMWWRRNGKYFPLMKLPDELQLCIFKHILGGIIYPRVKRGHGMRDSRIVMGPPEDSVFGPKGPLPNYNIFRVSKEVKKKALQAGWEGTQKDFKVLWEFPEVINCPNSPSEFNWLTKVRMSFNISQYFQFFGAKIVPGEHVGVSRKYGPLLQDIGSLKHLQLMFPSPYNMATENEITDNWRGLAMNPWSRMLAYGPSSQLMGLGPEQMNSFESNAVFPCQRTVVDWILTFAFPYIKHIPKVTLSGCVKHDQKKRWEKILAQECRKHKYETHFVWEDAMAVIELHPWYAPLLCSCPLSCNISNIDFFISDIQRSRMMPDNFDTYDEYTPELGERVNRLLCRLPDEAHLIFLGPEANIEALEAEYLPLDGNDLTEVDG